MNQPATTHGIALEAINLCKTYTLPRDGLFQTPQTVEALRQINFQIRSGQSLGLVGESGCGKSTLARLVTALEVPTSGSVRIDGTELGKLSKKELQQLRRNFQIISFWYSRKLSGNYARTGRRD